MIHYIRASIRLILVFLTTFFDLFVIFFNVYILKKDVWWGIRFRKNIWAKRQMTIGGVKLKTSGNIPSGPHLVVCNHRSSIDPLINIADIYCCPIAKIEFKSWPIIGQGSAHVGIVFVDRSSKESREQTRLDIAEALQNGMNILIYPEGVTHDNDLTRVFKKGSFEVAAQFGFPVLPVAIEYQDRSDNWDHSENFVVHFLKHFGKRQHHVELRYGPPIRSDNSWTLMRQSRSWIDSQIIEMRENFDGPNWRKEINVELVDQVSSTSDHP